MYAKEPTLLQLFLPVTVRLGHGVSIIQFPHDAMSQSARTALLLPPAILNFFFLACLA